MKKYIFIGLLTSIALTSNAQQIYKWKDEKGQWHFSSSAQGSKGEVKIHQAKNSSEGMNLCTGDCADRAKKVDFETEKNLARSETGCNKSYHIVDNTGKRMAKEARDECLSNKAAERSGYEKGYAGDQKQEKHREHFNDKKQQISETQRAIREDQKNSELRSLNNSLKELKKSNDEIKKSLNN